MIKELTSPDTTNVQLSIKDIELALEHDSEFFIQFFLGDALIFPVPDFHVDVFTLMTVVEIRKLVLAIPRDHAKTTLAKLAVIWYLLFTDYRFIIYVSSTVGIAVPYVNDIVNFLETDNFISVFGQVQWITKQDGVGLYVFKLRGKKCIIRAFGAGQHVRGVNVDNQRPQLAVLDDFEDNKNIATNDLFLKLKRWLYGPFKKCLDQIHNKMIHLGNMTTSQSILKEHCESEYWYSRHYGCLLKNKTSLWPDMWPMEKLKEDYQEYQNAQMADVWFAEMMNLPLAMGRGLIKANEISYRPAINPGEHEFGFMTIDLAISKESWGHKTVAAIHMWNGFEWQIADFEAWHGMDPVSLFYEIVPMMAKWGIRYCGIESVAFQASVKYYFKHMMLTEQIPEDAFIFVDCPARQQKTQRLAPWAGSLKKDLYVLTEGDFQITQQLLTYDPKKETNDDDIIDACAHGEYMIMNYQLEIMTKFQAYIPQGGYSTLSQVCSL